MNETNIEELVDQSDSSSQKEVTPTILHPQAIGRHNSENCQQTPAGKSIKKTPSDESDTMFEKVNLRADRSSNWSDYNTL